MKQKLMYDNKGRGLFPALKDLPPPPKSLLCSLLFRSITNHMQFTQACSMWQTSPVLEDLPHPPPPNSLFCITSYHMQPYTS